MTDKQTLEKIISQRIHEAGGMLPFNEFMRAALYEPSLGYYETKDIFGEHGDFVTAPDLGPWLELGLCDLLLWGWANLGCPTEWVLIEQGGGSGRLLVGVLNQLAGHNISMPSRIIEVECSSHLQIQQKELFTDSGFRIEHASTLAEIGELENVLVFSNELPDAFPVRCFCYKGGEFFERGVGYGSGFEWLDGSLPMSDGPDISDHTRSLLPDGYVSEWNPGLLSWQQDMASVICRGYSFCIDYGYAEQEYYRPNREEGTLLAHYNHQAVHTVLENPGQQDITAHVDFTALQRAGTACGLRPLLWMPQGAWLGQSPLVQQKIRSLAISPDAESLKMMAQARRMLLPFGMGEMFKLFVQASEGLTSTPPFLDQFDRLHDILSP
ncbi:MAG TPA: SAM-dependent methyltransferase [Mariprofundaceae bacterium]|nr:SAM-dependent methyltransferase [Mariprofundaceae bacterium]